MALRALTANKGRAALTMLGVIIGVAAVLALMSLGQGTQDAITDQIQSLGTNLLVVSPGSSSSGGMRMGFGSATTLTMADADALADAVNAPTIAAVAPSVSSGVQGRYSGNNDFVTVLGVTPEYATVRNVAVSSGQFITASDVEERSRVAVLGVDVVESLFDNANPIGQTVYLNGIAFRVIGVLESEGASSSNDQAAVIPITTAQSRLIGSSFYRGSRVVSIISVSVNDRSLMEQAEAEITQALRAKHRLSGSDSDDFQIQNQEEMLETMSTVTQMMTLLLASIAGISLLVGGIGIMNIMLVSVTERTREIGIRKAVGARRADLLMQFLVEAVVLSVAGGIIGVAVGVGIAKAVSGLEMSGSTLNASVNPSVVALAVLFSASVGVFFGVYPAWRAARLDPIVALRSE
ncbi:MAG: ABC transporter permease [Anaerolineae bacterium]